MKLNKLIKNGIPECVDFGVANKREYMACNLLGPNLVDLYDFCGSQFSVNTVIYVGLQILDLLQNLHSTGHVHNDVKIDNFVTHLNANSLILQMIDFGFTESYRDETTKEHKKKT